MLAYIDPGSGALLLQALLAALVGGLFYMRSFLLDIGRRVLGRTRTPVDEPEVEQPAGTETESLG